MAEISDSEQRRERDMILAPNEYAFIRDETKGEVNVFQGPNKTSLAGTDRPVVFDPKTKRFRPCNLVDGIQLFTTAPEGWYIVLKNNAEGEKHPSSSGKLSTPELRVGKKVNIAGPASFALWPGQMAKVVQGHSLRSNEYLIVRVYDEDAARANWSKGVVKTQAIDPIQPSVDGVPVKDLKKASAQSAKPTLDAFTEKDLTMGKQLVIRGTEVSFYIPPTGIEVVPEKVNGEERYVREAVSLERLEYCLLLDQNGSKRYVQGPDVVFPRPTEKFVEAPIKSNPEKVKAKKFRAQELTKQMGIHIRVITDYVEASGEIRTVGQELFITGETTPVYFPREEHAIIKYGEQDVHYGIAIPAGEARYVLNRETGIIEIVKGPLIFLADPRTQVIAQRALPLQMCELLYPGNAEAMEINAARLGMDDQDIMGAAGANAAFLNSSYTRADGVDESYSAVGAVVVPDTTRKIMIRSASKSLPGDSFDRKSKFTAPRSVILNTKYDGAVVTSIWTGFAMLLSRKSGERRVVQGPGTFMLEYDESPQVISLSTGKPKTTDKMYKTVFLQTTANMVTDVIEVETRDFCKLNVKLSYRVNFEGDPNQWFNVDNYVKFLCDHMRSRVRNAVKKLGIEEFYSSHTELLRDIVLGKSEGDGKPRTGMKFTENGMRIYEVEVLKVDMHSADVEKLLVNSQRDIIQNTLVLAAEQRKLDYTQKNEEIKRAIADTNAETRRLALELQAEEAKRKLSLDMTVIETNATAARARLAEEQAETTARNAAELENERARQTVSIVANEISQAEADQRLAIKAKEQELELQKTREAVQAIIEKAKAITPGLIEALNSFGEREMIAKITEAMAPMSLLGGGSAVDIVKKIFEGTSFAQQLGPALSNGAALVEGAVKRGRSTHS